MGERGLTEVTRIPSRIRSVAVAAAVSDTDDLRRLCHPRIAVEPI